jgi:hypothetical protein
MSTATLPREAGAQASLHTNAGLTVERTDILFADVAPGRVGIEITVTNLGDHLSTPTYAAIQAAPLGAFVPWQPLAVLPVPVLGPGESFVLRTEAVRPAPKPLGPPDRVPPRQLLTAVNPQDERPQPPSTQMRTPRALPATPTLPSDLLQLMGQGGVHWAGNLNVFVGSKAVERHMAQALRIYPGRLNMAMFVVGNGRPDAYRFQMTATGDLSATLHDTTGRESLTFDLNKQTPLSDGKWIEAPGQFLMMLALSPAKDCGKCDVAVHVAQRSSGAEAIVEFSLDPKAAGPGCYTV